MRFRSFEGSVEFGAQRGQVVDIGDWVGAGRLHFLDLVDLLNDLTMHDAGHLEQVAEGRPARMDNAFIMPQVMASLVGPDGGDGAWAADAIDAEFLVFAVPRVVEEKLDGGDVVRVIAAAVAD